MITTEQVASTPGESVDGAFGVWHRSFNRRPELERLVGWTRLRVFQKNKNALKLNWLVETTDPHCIAYGEASDWESALAVCEHAARAYFEKCLTKLGAKP